MDRLTTGQMAEMNGVTKKTLLVYQKNGILLPEIVDEETGYRYYSISQSSILDIIRRLQDIGLSIKEIRTVLDNRDVDYMETLLKRKRLALARQIEELELARLSNESLLDSCRIFKERPVCGVPALEWVPRGRRCSSRWNPISWRSTAQTRRPCWPAGRGACAPSSAR